MKYILVTGGVISGVGKGVISSSFGTLLDCCGIDVTSIKIDPYINIDAGTFSPYEHGEVYVLDDGGEVDLDLGNYERFLDISLCRDNNITTGKVYKQVIEKERRGDYRGKTVQVVPHITDAIQKWVEKVAQRPVKGDKKPQVCIIELGGTIGDIEGMPFIEAFRQFQFRVKPGNFCVAHVSLVPMPRATGEPKTKPIQSSVRELRGLGLSPDLIVCRSERPIDNEVKDKISNFCHVAPEQVICIPDLSSIYHVPLQMESNGVLNFLRDRLELDFDDSIRMQKMKRWQKLTYRIDNTCREVKISLVGKYTKLEDSYASVSKSLRHAAIAVGFKLNLKFIEACHLEKDFNNENRLLYQQAWQDLCESDGVIVPGGFGSRGMEGKILACEWSRENKKPLLGICLGMQAAVIEFARNICGFDGANTTEIDPNVAHPLVIDMPEHHQGIMGGTIRLGKRTTVFKENCSSTIRKLYGSPNSVDERHRHRYEINPKYVHHLEESGLKFVGTDEEKTRMEIVELENHPYYVGVQYHPEYLSRPLKPSPPFMGLILASVDKLQSYLENFYRPQKQEMNDNSSDDDEQITNDMHKFCLKRVTNSSNDDHEKFIKSKNAFEASQIIKNSQIVCFDVDSTVIREEGIDELAKFCGKGKEVARLTKEAMNGSMTFQEALQLRLNIIQPTQQQIQEFLKSRPSTLSPGIEEFVHRLRDANKSVYLISGGFSCLIEPIAKALGIPFDHIFTNKLYFRFNGEYAGFDVNQPTSRTGGKSEAIHIIRKSLDQAENVNVTMIGDGVTDLEASPPANNFVGYGGNVIREEVCERSKFFVIDFHELFIDL